jgi:alpha-1,2-mannosyltransferase
MSVSAERRSNVAGRDGLWLALRRLGPPAFLGLLPLAVLAMAAASAIHHGNVGVDFRGELYPEAKLVVHGHNPFPPSGADLSRGVNRIFPVPAALLVGPLTALPAAAATAVFEVVLLTALVATLAVLGVRDWRVYGAVALWPSTIAALQTGNLSILLGLLVALAWRWRDSRLLPGVALGLAIALKLFLWPLVIWLVAIRRYAAAAVAATLAAAGTLLVLPFVSLGSYEHLMRNLGDTFGRESYNLVGLLEQSGIAGRSTAHLIATLAGIAVLAIAYRERSLPLALAASLLLSPIVWLHYFVLLAVPLALVSPRFSAVWLVPLLLWLCPGSGEDVRLRHIATALFVLGAVTVLAHARRHRNRQPEERAWLADSASLDRSVDPSLE